jgi:hypothetical protein
MTVIKLICTASCVLMAPGALAYAGVAGLRAVIRPRTNDSPRDVRRAAVRVGTGG